MYIWQFEQTQLGDNITSGRNGWCTQSGKEMGNWFSKNPACSHETITKESSDATLALLRIDLPDPDQDLYPQVIQSLNLKSFEFFSQLPLELRVYIWRLTVPGRRVVSFDQECLGPNYPAVLKGPSHQDPLPVTLYVSQESRYETLRHYKVILRGSVFGYTPKEKPICFNPSLDTAYITPFSLNPAKTPFARWMSWLTSQSPNVLDEIKELEIRHMPWNATARQYLESPENKLQGPMAAILWFRALKKLSFTGTREYPLGAFFWATLQTPEEIEDCKTTLTNWFDKRQEIFVGGNAPEIIVRPWQHILASKS